MKDWTEFGLRPLPPMSGRSRVVEVPPIQFLLDPLFAGARAELDTPVAGITTDGTVRRGIFPEHAVATEPIVAAAQAFLEALPSDLRARVCFDRDAEEKRSWYNVHMNFFRHGVMLEDMAPAPRQAALDLLRASLSARGFDQARDIMRLNELLGQVTGSHDEFGEWPYFVSIFGTPSMDEPWAWQFDGHHLNVNCMVLGHQMVLTPTFMGSEPCAVADGPFAGIQVFADEERVGLDLIRSMNTAQSAEAILYPSIMPGTLPAHLEHWIDGRMAAGAFKDNLVLPYQGIRADRLSEAQRHLLTNVVATYVGWGPHDHAAARMTDVEAHLDETWFSWFGGTGLDDPFYYRVHSPVVLVEFDHHPGVVFDNVEPSRHHIHTIIRTPNGGDYGIDLLGRHHAEHVH